MDWKVSDDNYNHLKRLFSRLRRGILPSQANMRARLDSYIQEWLETDDGQAFTQWASSGDRGFDADQFARIDAVMCQIESMGQDPNSTLMHFRNPLLSDVSPVPLLGLMSKPQSPYWPDGSLLPKEALEKGRVQDKTEAVPPSRKQKTEFFAPIQTPKPKRSANKSKLVPDANLSDIFKDSPPLTPPSRPTVARTDKRPAHPKVSAPKKPKAASNLPPSYAKLERMIGLEDVKQTIVTRANTFKANRERERQGGKSLDTSMHMVFTGNPGTGKTETARLVGEIYRDMGLLSTGSFVDTTPADLIVGFVRQTGENTRKKIEEAVGGVLFIDEAYGLAKADPGRDFGPEAVNELIVGMENHRDDLVVILAGYADEMNILVKSNPGFESRVRTFIDFPDYKPEDLQAIFMKMCQDNQLKLDGRAKKKLATTIRAMYDQRGETFGNGREVRNLLDRCIERQSDRLYGSDDSYDESDIWVLTEDDIPGPSQT